MGSIRRQFEQFRHKKILIYGTGKIAESVLSDLKGFNIVGIIDKVRFEGKLMDIPILIWDDIDRNTADIIIIAALRKNYKIIYERIQYYCNARNISIYGEKGENLSKEYEFKYITPLDRKYFQKNELELKKLMDQYDAISFDLFDILVMRKTLEAEDVYDIVEEKIREKGILISNFKKKRRTAQLQSGHNIYAIYRKLRSMEGISESDSGLALQEEIECERKCLAPRKIMVELMNYAVKKGKQVSIIADTCFPAAVVEKLLCGLNIKKYGKLYLSSEHETGKASEILEAYKGNMGGQSCLHIGTGEYMDEMMLQKYGIDFYEVKSTYKMLKMSSLRKLLSCPLGVDNRIILGLIAARIFNNPFILYNRSGVVKIEKPDKFAVLFIAPVVLVYMQNMMQVIQKKQTDIILFTSRDGYLFKKIYDNCFAKTIKIPSLYFLTSRKLCLRSIIDFEDNILNLYHNFSTENGLEIFLDEFLQEELSLYEDPKTLNVKTKLIIYQDKLKQKSCMMRENYLKYMETIDFDRRKKYLFCDLNSMGTIHEALNKILNMDLDGFYLYRRVGFRERKLNVISVYDNMQGNNIERFRDLLEVVLTSRDPSVCGMDETGAPIYSSEKRTKQELHILEIQHKAIMDFIQEYVELRGSDKIISKEFADMVLGLYDCVDFEDEMVDFMCKKNIDDMTQKCISILNQ